MLIVVAAIIALLWLLGFIGNIGGGFIHLLLIVALVIVIYDLLVRRPRARPCHLGDGLCLSRGAGTRPADCR